jgi:hypothetical protein
MLFFEMGSANPKRDVKVKRIHEAQMMIVTLDNHLRTEFKDLCICPMEHVPQVGSTSASDVSSDGDQTASQTRG